MQRLSSVKGWKKVWLISCAIMLVVCSACGTATGNGNADGIKGPEGPLPEIIEQIYGNKDPGIAVGTLEIDMNDPDSVKFYTGLDSTDSVSEIAVSEAMISAQAYSLVLVRVTDAGAAEDVAREMKEGINPNKWVCVMADDLQVVACGDVVMLVMMSSTFSDMVTSDEIVDAFREVCGGTLTLE